MSTIIRSLLLVVAFCSTAQAADFKWWTTSNPNAVTNGAITLKNASGSSRAIVSNPTGANVATRIANTQAPTVIVQATASMPIKAIGDPCVAVTAGTASAPTAEENHAITSDRTSLLTCQSGVWKKVTGIFSTIQYGLANPYGTLLLSSYIGAHRFCTMSAFRSPVTGAASCQVNLEGNAWIIYVQNEATTDGSWCHATCFD